MADTPAVRDEGDDDRAVETPGAGDIPDTPDVGVSHPTGAEQAAINRENEPPA